jgi:diacylglycerol kinase family enzyme
VPAFRKAALIYNPAAGMRQAQRAADVESAAEILRAAGVEVRVEATRGPGTASRQAMEAVEAGCEAILGCGGDGTIHELMQEMVSSHATAALGVIPLGTGNGLAADLGIPRRPTAAARMLLTAEARRIAVGKIEATEPGGETQSRYFIIGAGVGADAEMLYRLSLDFKKRHGMAAYYARALRLIATHRFVAFEVEFRNSKDPQQSAPRREVVSQALAVRITSFGGLIHKLAPGASLHRDEMRLLLFTSPRRGSFVRHVVASSLGREWKTAGVELAFADLVNCTPLAPDAPLPPAWRGFQRGVRVYAEADGEVVGGLPVRLSTVPDALTLLMPLR